MGFRFSLLITVYKGVCAEWLDACLASVRSQTLPPDQLILVQDGELPDKSERVIRDYHSVLPVLWVRKKGPEGAGAAANFGLKHCKHPWIARLDADDLAMNRRFELQANYLFRHPETDVLSGYLTEYSRPGETNDGRLRLVPTEHKAIARMMQYRCPINNPCVMLRAAKVREAGGYDSFQTHEDYLLWMKMLALGCRFANLPQSLVSMRMNTGGLKRRHGFYAIRQEYKFQRTLLKRKYISFPIFLRNLPLRLLPRLLPLFLLSRFYSYFLRKKIP